MLLISNNAQKYMDIPAGAVVRVNMAWVKTVEDLQQILAENAEREVFLDYPEGRNKPPKPTLTLEDAYTAMRICDNIKYFAVSNVEDIDKVKRILINLPEAVQFVPKIETMRGVKRLGELVYDCGIKIMQLDKEDLYLDVKKDNDRFFKCIDHIRGICKGLNVELLELEGVIFMTKTL